MEVDLQPGYPQAFCYWTASLDEGSNQTARKLLWGDLLVWYGGIKQMMVEYK